MTQDIQRLIDEYHRWLRAKTALREINDHWVEITTPYLDRHNDYVQIYVKQNEDGFILTDDGYTIDDLEQSGCKLESPRRQDLLRMTLNGFGIRIDGKSLHVNAAPAAFALKKHNLVQAILAVNDLFYLTVPTVASLYHEDVVSWLDMHEIRYTPRVKFTGKTGYDYLFDFVIPKSKQQPERIVQAINQPNKNTAQSVVLSWIDTREVRSPESRAYALLNDSEGSLSSPVSEALRSYEVRPVPWSKRESILEELAA